MVAIKETTLLVAALIILVILILIVGVYRESTLLGLKNIFGYFGG